MDRDTDIGDIYLSIDRFASLLPKIDIGLRLMTAFLYAVLIGEIIGVPLPQMISYLTKYAQILPVLLKPFRTQILFVTLIVDFLDAIFGPTLIRLEGKIYVKVITPLLFLLGMLTFFGYPSLIIFLVLVLPKIISLSLILSYPESIDVLVNVYAKGSFE